MVEAFDTAALRHWRDGKLLEREMRFSNSDQLYGFAAECAIKSALTRLPALLGDDGRLLERYREHISDLWDRARLQSIQRRFPVLATVLQTANPFQEWTTDHRYAADEAGTPAARARHRDNAKRLLGAVGLLGARAGA